MKQDFIQKRPSKEIHTVQDGNLFDIRKVNNLKPRDLEMEKKVIQESVELMDSAFS